jgi:hypothetical protein
MPLPARPKISHTSPRRHNAHNTGSHPIFCISEGRVREFTRRFPTEPLPVSEHLETCPLPWTYLLFHS